MNYYKLLCNMYPDKLDILWYMKYPLHHHLYAYGEHSKMSWEKRGKYINKIMVYLYYFYRRFKQKKIEGNKTIVSSAGPAITDPIKQQGYNIIILNFCMSFRSYRWLYEISNISFNRLISDKCKDRVDEIKEELKEIFKKNDIKFLLLINDVLPLAKIAIKSCKELGIPTGVFLHGLPAEYDLIDNFSADYTFVWGEAIKDNYLKLGCETPIIVTGNPIYSEAYGLSGTHNQVVVISFCAGDVYDGASDTLADRGLCVQYAYSVERVLKEFGVNQAILRVHPHEKIEWYKKFIDTDFYILDNLPLMKSLSRAKYLIGPISSVVIDAVSHNVPYYSYILTKDVNSHSWEIVPPFRKEDGLPVAYSEAELQDNLENENYIRKEDVSSYYASAFDVMSITQYFLS